MCVRWIADVLDALERAVSDTRRQYVEEGTDMVLKRVSQFDQYQKMDGRAAPHLAACDL